MSFDNLIIRASAGTGKTFRLSNRYLGLLAAGENPAQILASTFTRKAAGEILDRIVERLAEAATDDEACQSLSQFLEIEQALTRAQATALLGTLLRGLHRVRVSTLDAFFSKLARSFSLDIGLNPGWTVLDNFSEAKLKDESIRLALAEQGASKMMHLLAKGAAERSVSVLVRDTINSLHELFVRTSEQAWTRISEKKTPSTESIELAFNQLQRTELDTESLTGTKNADLEKFSQEQWSRFLSTGLAKKVFEGDPRFRNKPLPDAIVNQYQVLVDFASAKLVNRLVAHTQGTYQLLKSFNVHFQRLKRLQGAYSFSDITRTVAQSLQDQPFDSLVYRSDESLNHLLLDEFQDTSPDQWNVVRRFAARTVEDREQRSFFCVGDVKQAIYGWRGGEAKIFDTVNEQLENVVVAPSMNHSRRSSQTVIRTVNHVFENALKHDNLQEYEIPVQNWCASYESHTAESKTSGYARLETSPEDQDCFERAAQIVAELRAHKVPLTIGILVRTNASVSAMIYHLAKRNIRASEEGGNPLIDSVAVNLILSTLKWIDHPGDSASFFHFSQSPLGRHWKIPKAHSAIKPFINSAAGAELNQALRTALLEQGYDAAIQEWADVLWSHCNQRETTRLRQLLDQAGLWNPRMTLRTTDFVEHLQSVKVSDASDDPVRVMNVHQSKGLEFDAVILPELNGRFVGQNDPVLVDAPDPSQPPKGVIRYPNKELRALLPNQVERWHEQYQGRRINESLCILYVAMTRAREALYMIVDSNPKEKKLPRTFDGLLRATLGEGAIAPSEGIPLFESGEPKWVTLEKKSESSIAADVPAEPTDENEQEAATTQPVVDVPTEDNKRSSVSSSLQIAWKETESTNARSREVVSPSSLEGGPRRDVVDLLQGHSPLGSLFGSVIHAWFEQIQWLPSDIETRLNEMLAQRKSIHERMLRLSGVSQRELQFEELDHYFCKAIGKPEIQALLSLEGTTERFQKQFENLPPGSLRVENERRFVTRASVGFRNERLLQGSMDRVVWYEQEGKILAAEIIDYKTDKWDSADLFSLSEKKTYYQPQLHAYRDAVSQLCGLGQSNIAAQLVFLEPTQIVPLIASKQSDVAS